MIEDSKAAMIGNGLEFLHGLQAIVDMGMTDDPKDAADRSVTWLREQIEAMDLDERADRILQLQLIIGHCQLLTQIILVFTATGRPEPWEGS